MSSVLSLFPSRVRFVNPDGTLTPEGYRAMEALYDRVGGAIGDNGVDTFGIVMAAGSDQGSSQNTDITLQQVQPQEFIAHQDIQQPQVADQLQEMITQSQIQDQFQEMLIQPTQPDFLEGIWTPTQGAGLVVVGAFSSSGRYVRIGRQITVTGTISAATSIATVAAGVFVGGLPFTIINSGTGAASNQANNAGSILVGTVLTIISVTAVAATPSLTFSFTYFV